MGNWNKERAKKRSDDTIDSLPIKDIEIKGYVRDMDLMGLDTVCSDLNRPGCQKVHVVRSIVLQDERIARLIFDKREVQEMALLNPISYFPDLPERTFEHLANLVC